MAQPNNENIIEPYLITENQLHFLLNKVQSAPLINENCAINNCVDIEKFHNELYNLREDLHAYRDFLYLSKSSARGQWEVYLNKNIRNENLKGQMQYNLAFKDYLSDISASLLDITSIIKSFKAGSFDTVTTSIKLLNRIILSLTELDEQLSGLDETLTGLAGLADVSETYKSYHGKWKTFYGTFKYSLSTVKESITIYKSIGNSENLSPKELSSKRISKGANIVALVAQLLNMYSSYERNEMKKAIEEFDKVLKANENVQSHYYDKYAVQVGLLDQIIKIQEEVNKRYYSLYGLHLKCNGKQIRKQRNEFVKNKGTFRKGLDYYKEKLIETSNKLRDSWEEIEICGGTSPYQFVIKDGVGNRYDATIKITRVWDNKVIIDNKRTFYLRQSTVFNLLPHTYNIEILEGDGSNGSRVSKAFFSNVEIDASENSIIVFEPFGRLELDVISKKVDVNAPSYKYVISKSAYATKIVEAKGQGKVILDLPLSISLSVDVKTMSKEFSEANIRVNPNTIKNLQFVLDDNKVSNTKSKEYAFKILDGIGKERSAYLEIIRSSDGKNLYKESADSKTKFNLIPDNYSLKLHSGYTKSGIKSQEVLLEDYMIKGDEEEVLELSPYGRISLKVVDKEGKPISFSYRFFDDKEKIITYSLTSTSEERIMDLPINNVYNLELGYGYNYEKEIKKGISILPKQLNKLHYIYDDGKFIEDKSKTVNKKPLSSTSSHETIALKNRPEGWVSGVLSNSNDGKCSAYKGKYLIFVNRDSKFFNLETGGYSESIIVGPGERVNVAAPENGGHFRAYPTDDQYNSKTYGTPASFWYPKGLKNGWWYSAGCSDGTKPSSNCSDANQNNGINPNSECYTIND